MAYCRCRRSDTLQIEDVEHDHSEMAGYIQLRTRYHQGSKTAAKTADRGIVCWSWIAGVDPDLVGESRESKSTLGRPLLPAPREDGAGWTKRPVAP